MIVVDVDEIHGGWVCRKGEAGESICNAGGEREWTDGFKVAEGDFTVLFGFGGRNVNSESDGQVVGYGEVGAGDIVDVEASGADQV